MWDNVEHTYRFVIPGVMFAILLAPIWWLCSFPIPSSLLPYATVVVGIITGSGFIYHLVLKRILESGIDRAWTRPCFKTWESELQDWRAKSWLLPNARLGYRLRRMRYLAEQDPLYRTLLPRVTSGHARGFVDVAAWDNNPKSGHSRRLAYFYSELGIIVNCFFFAGAYVISAVSLLIAHFAIWKVLCLVGGAIFLLVVALIFRGVAADEIERAEGFQYAMSVATKEDTDWCAFCRALDQLRQDLQVRAASGEERVDLED